MQHNKSAPHLSLMPQMIDSQDWLELILETGVAADQRGIEFLLSLRSVDKLWCEVVDRILGNHTWMMPSVGNGFSFVQNQLPLALYTARNALATRNPMVSWAMVSDSGIRTFRDNVNMIVAGMNAYRSDLPTQARCMAGLITLFKDRIVVQSLNSFMFLEKEHGLQLVRALLWAMRVHQNELDVVMLAATLLRIICRATRFGNIKHAIGVDCDGITVLMATMRANMQNPHLLMFFYAMLRELALDSEHSRAMLRKSGGVELIRNTLQTIGTYSRGQIHHEIQAFRPLTGADLLSPVLSYCQ